jgi:ligand-binding SRPBCC domain-containing protein
VVIAMSTQYSAVQMRLQSHHLRNPSREWRHHHPFTAERERKDKVDKLLIRDGYG